MKHHHMEGISKYDTHYRCSKEAKFVPIERADMRETGAYCPDCGTKLRKQPLNKKAWNKKRDQHFY